MLACYYPETCLIVNATEFTLDEKIFTTTRDQNIYIKMQQHKLLQDEVL